METLATVDIANSITNDDALRHWLIGNGYEWKYDAYGRLTYIINGVKYRAMFKYLGNNTLRIYTILA